MKPVYPHGTTMALRMIFGRWEFVHLIPSRGERKEFHTRVFDLGGTYRNHKLGPPIQHQIKNFRWIGLDTPRGPYRLHDQLDSREKFPFVPEARRGC